MSLLTRLRQLPIPGRTTAGAGGPEGDPNPAPDPHPGPDPDPDSGADPGADRARGRRYLGWGLTALAALLVLFALLLPNDRTLLTPGGFLRIPLEGLLVLALILGLPARMGRVVAVLAGAAIGVLAILKLIDMGFLAVLARPFDPVLDWSLLAAARGFLAESIGEAGATGVVVGAVLLAAAVVVLTALSALRLRRVLVRHGRRALGTGAVLGLAWVVCALLAVQVVPGVPVAAHEYDRLSQVYASMQDRREFAAEAAVDQFRDTPGEELLTALRGKDVVITFIESYGRDAVENPQFAPQIGALLDAGHTRLSAAGLDSRSAFLTAATVGGASWLNHATLRSGLWIDNQQRYRTLVASDRLTLNRAFQRAGWRSVAVMPGIWETWPEGVAIGYDQIYDAERLDYQGPRTNWGIIPDQYAMSVFERSERATPDRAPVMAEVALLSSHAPWAPIPQLADWDRIADGTGMSPRPGADDPAQVARRGPAETREAYRDAVGYSLQMLISYLETYGDDDLVFIFLGDHQPSPLITGEGATRDVPITIVTGDPAVLDRISSWGWDEGLRPGPAAPVWQMDTFRDRFLTAFGAPPR